MALTSINYSYDDNGNITSIKERGNALNSYREYTYTKDNRVATLKEGKYAEALGYIGKPFETVFTYDDKWRLIKTVNNDYIEESEYDLPAGKGKYYNDKPVVEIRIKRPNKEKYEDGDIEIREETYKTPDTTYGTGTSESQIEKETYITNLLTGELIQTIYQNSLQNGILAKISRDKDGKEVEITYYNYDNGQLVHRFNKNYVDGFTQEEVYKKVEHKHDNGDIYYTIKHRVINYKNDSNEDITTLLDQDITYHDNDKRDRIEQLVDNLNSVREIFTYDKDNNLRDHSICNDKGKLIFAEMYYSNEKNLPLMSKSVNYYETPSTNIGKKYPVLPVVKKHSVYHIFIYDNFDRIETEYTLQDSPNETIVEDIMDVFKRVYS